jgi:hypothetical protein
MNGERTRAACLKASFADYAITTPVRQLSPKTERMIAETQARLGPERWAELQENNRG